MDSEKFPGVKRLTTWFAVEGMGEGELEMVVKASLVFEIAVAGGTSKHVDVVGRWLKV